MSETATTEQLPLLPTEAIRDATVNMSGGLSAPELFDRWLESIMQEAHIAERERIIKQLEALDKKQTKIYGIYSGFARLPVQHVIAYIKGENK